ncbi:MAG: universal stress protein [Terriglobales bacterium]
MPVSVPVRIGFQNILVATDFSPSSAALLPFARSLARHYNSTLFLTHVISDEVLGVDPAMIEQARRNAETRMRDLELNQQLEGVRHKTILEEGQTWDVLKQVIAREEIDLIIVGTHGRTGLKKFMLGSVAEDIFRHAPCPVLTIGPHATGTPDGSAITHVLLATDLKPENNGPAMYACLLAQQHKARLTLLHVAETDSRVPLPKQLLDLVPKDIDLPFAPDAVIHIGEAAEMILNTALQRHVGLIVLGAHRPAMLTTHLMDVAYRVVCEAKCPVLTVGAEFHT